MQNYYDKYTIFTLVLKIYMCYNAQKWCINVK